MPRAANGTYALPTGYQAVDGEDATAEQHNAPLEDLRADANAPRPIVAGGTGATTAEGARTALGLGTAATSATEDYATAAQGVKADDAMPKAGGTFTGPVINNGSTSFKGITETVVSLTGTAPVIDLSLGTVFTITTAGNTAPVFPDPATIGAGLVRKFELVVTAGGTHSITWPASVKWPGGSPPDAPANGERDRIVFSTEGGSAFWDGVHAGDAFA